MFPKLAVLCLLFGVVQCNLGQGFGNGQNSNGQQGQNPYYNSNNNGQNQGQNPYNTNQGQNPYGNNQGQGLGQGYNNNNQGQGLGQGYSNNGQNAQPGIGQGYNGGYSGLGQNNNNGYQNGYSGLGQNVDNSNRGLTPLDNGRDTTLKLKILGDNQRSKRQLGQGMNPQGLGSQGIDQNSGTNSGGLGQGIQSSGLGQGVQPQGLGQGIDSSLGGNQGGGLGGNLRKKRYSEREPYRKTCNTYYGKYICYRLYEKDASIPNDFTCWQTYLGKKNCTETENILYLDRRNVEVDPSEGLDRQYYPNRDEDRRQPPRLPESTRRDRTRNQDDEFGAVEKNMHNQRNGQRRLPSEDDDF